MDYYQGVVLEFLHEKKTMFMNPEYILELLHPDTKWPAKGTYWIVDILAIDIMKKAVYLCEVTYSRNQYALIKKLEAWETHWAGIKLSLQQELGLDLNWTIQPWCFVPECHFDSFKIRMPKFFDEFIKVTKLEETVPWFPTRQPDDDTGEKN